MKDTASKGRFATPEPILALLLMLLLAGLSLASPNFRQPSNYLGMTRFFVEIGLIALPMTFVIITGGMDLSVGSLVALAAVTLGIAWRDWHLSIWTATALGVLVASVGGLINGALIVGFRIPPLIVTLATMAAYRGVAVGISRGDSIGGFPAGFRVLGRGFYYLPYGIEVPGQLIYLVVLAVVFWVLLSRTVTGRQVYAIGLNEAAARYAGIPVDWVKLVIYTLSGAMAGLAGAVLASRVSTATPDLGLLFELDAITACVLGGVSISGGRGTILGSMLGLCIVGSLKRGLFFLGVQARDQSIIIGIVLILAVFVHQVLVPAVRNWRLRLSHSKEGST